MFLHNGLDARLKSLETAAASVPESVRADVVYPADVIKNVNRGRLELGAFNVQNEIGRAETILASAKGGKDPFKGRTGDFERHYLLQGANEVMPYRVYVPKGYAASKAHAARDCATRPRRQRRLVLRFGTRSSRRSSPRSTAS